MKDQISKVFLVRFSDGRVGFLGTYFFSSTEEIEEAKEKHRATVQGIAQHWRIDLPFEIEVVSHWADLVRPDKDE